MYFRAQSVKAAVFAALLLVQFPVTATAIRNSQGGITLSPATAVLIEQANKGDADAANTLGIQYGNGLSVMQNDREALKWYRMAVRLGSVEASLNLATAYQNGFGVPEDHAIAAQWYGKAARAGLADAQNSLGKKYETGDGVTRNLTQAALWYGRAAAQGLDAARISLKALTARDRPVK